MLDEVESIDEPLQENKSTHTPHINFCSAKRNDGAGVLAVVFLTSKCPGSSQLSTHQDTDSDTRCNSKRYSADEHGPLELALGQAFDCESQSVQSGLGTGGTEAEEP